MLSSTDVVYSSMLKVDTNKDRLVTLEEFLKSTEKKEFNNAKEWEVRGELQVGKVWQLNLSFNVTVLSPDSGQRAGVH